MSSSRKFTQLDQHAHILLKPNTYISSIIPEVINHYLYDPITHHIIKKDYNIVFGLIKISSEIIENATDESIRNSRCNTIEISVQKNNLITVYNDGDGIPIEFTQNKDGKKMYLPEFLFSELLTSSHYSEEQEDISIGTNGIGAKATNIFSIYFNIEIVDANHKKYVQTFSKNMYNKTEPEISDVPKNIKPYTKISFIPDYSRFGLTELSDDLVNLLHKKAIDVSLCGKSSLKVYFNNELIKTKSLYDYIKLYLPDIPNENIVIAKLNDNWSFAFVYTPNSGFHQISFVNNAITMNGGSHVNYINNQITKYLTGIITKKVKDYKIRPIDIQDNITLFVIANIKQETTGMFNSQSKDTLKCHITKSMVGDIPDDILTKIGQTGIVQCVINLIQAKKSADLKKTDGKKTKKVDVKKYVPANKAGGPQSYKCRLIITEGDSAKTFGMWGIEIIGHDYYGIFPIRGKMLNTRNATAERVKKNEEIIALKHILGLKQGVVYTKDNINQLNYGGILILADQDLDGFHIKGLVINFIHTFWRELCMIDGFFQTLQTPILKAKHNKDIKTFYNEKDYRDWAASLGGEINKWKIQYYKGLGTSTENEAKECFREFDKKCLNFTWEDVKVEPITAQEITEYTTSELSDSISLNGGDDQIKRGKKNIKPIENPTISDEALILAFAKDDVAKRKKWLQHYDKDTVLIPQNQQIGYSEFVNKELIHFSNDDNIRSIPSIYDGLKPSQRKILFTMLENKSNEKIKVANLASKVSDRTNYIHGEVSLAGAIINMAQNFVGSNNINLLKPKGNFGTRRIGGEDAAATRYIFTRLDDLTRLIFRPEDDIILNYLIEEGDPVEPEHYYPIIPMCLINGATGIGTGYSTSIPCYNPIDIINDLIMLLEDHDDIPELVPWYRGFTGTMTKLNKNTFESHGKYTIQGDKIYISELPIQTWTDPYYDKYSHLDIIKSDKNNSNPGDINIIFTLVPGELQMMYKDNSIEKDLGLVSKIKTSNLVLYNKDNTLVKYDNPNLILLDFYNNRLLKYRDRKIKYLQILNNQLMILKYKMKYINEVINKTIIIEHKKRNEVIQQLIDKEYPKLSTDINAIDDNDIAEENKSSIVKYKTYDYIIKLDIFSLTQDKLDQLQKQIDDKQAEYDKYNNTPIKELWKQELIELRDKYLIWVNKKSNLQIAKVTGRRRVAKAAK